MESEVCQACELAETAGVTGDLDDSDVECRSELSTDESEDGSEAHGAGGDQDAEPIYDETWPGVSDDQLNEAALLADLYGTSEGDDSDEETLLQPAGAGLRVRRRRRATVRMPTGKKYDISTPRPRVWKCPHKSKLYKLHPFGRTKKEYNIVHKEMQKTKVQHPGYQFSKFKIISIQKVINGCLWKQYLHRQKEIKVEIGYVNQRMLFHGSTVVNEIANEGFNEQFSNVSGMFGAGIYFAKNSSKANQYVFSSGKAGGCPNHHTLDCKQCERKMLLCRVTLGKTKKAYKVSPFSHPPAGFNSVTGVPNKRLKYPEYVVYRREQVYPEFLITYKIE